MSPLDNDSQRTVFQPGPSWASDPVGGQAIEREPAGAARAGGLRERHQPAVTRRVQAGEKPRDVLREETELQVEDILPDRLHEPDGERAKAQREREADEQPRRRRQIA